ncbi:MAG: hypothetical protein WA906_06185 [Pacificimonas sp.]
MKSSSKQPDTAKDGGADVEVAAKRLARKADPDAVFGAKLRQVYSCALDEPIGDDLQALLDSLE